MLRGCVFDIVPLELIFNDQLIWNHIVFNSGVNIFQKNQNYSATRPENWKTFPERDYIVEWNNSVTHTNLEEIFENSG